MENFNLKSGNKTSFKDMGSSPTKHWKDGKTDEEKLAAAYHNEHMRKKSPAKQADKNLLRAGGKINSNSWLTEHGKKLVKEAQMKMPKNFNIKGDPSTTPKFDATKLAKNIAKKPTGIMGRTVGHAAKTLVRGALGTAGAAAGLLYEFGKESIKRKKAGKSGFNIAKPKKNKGFNF